MAAQKRIALIAHDERKQDLLEWAEYNRDSLSKHVLYGTGTTGALLSRQLGLSVITVKSGPLGGDQQIGARIVEGVIDVMIFFWDPLASHPHDPDVRALLRVAVMQNIPVATNRASADFMFSSPLMDQPYERQIYDFAKRLRRSPIVEALQDEDSQSS
ncbi:MAG: methylglyoxal synthase [Anaerolineae bacterium]|nr:methylglyoxal synthase [Anaerolineae bacterium]